MTLLALDDRRWREFVESRPDSTIFHHPMWAKLLADCYGYRAMAVVLEAGGAVTAGLPAIDVSLPVGPRRWVSLPFTDHCPPLACGDGADLIGILGDLAGSSFDVLELREAVSDPTVQSGGAFVRHDLALSDDVASTLSFAFGASLSSPRIVKVS